MKKSKPNGAFGNTKTRAQRLAERAHAFVSSLAKTYGASGTIDPNVRPPTVK